MVTDYKFFTCEMCGKTFFGHRLPSDSDAICPHCLKEYPNIIPEVGNANENQYRSIRACYK